MHSSQSTIASRPATLGQRIGTATACAVIFGASGFFISRGVINGNELSQTLLLPGTMIFAAIGALIGIWPDKPKQ